MEADRAFSGKGRRNFYQLINFRASTTVFEGKANNLPKGTSQWPVRA